MGFHYRKRIKLFPGVWFNLSKSGISTSIGGKGLTVNLKGDKSTATASLPGTGLSYREAVGEDAAHQPAANNPATAPGIPAWVWVLLFVAVVVLVLN